MTNFIDLQSNLNNFKKYISRYNTLQWKLTINSQQFLKHEELEHKLLIEVHKLNSEVSFSQWSVPRTDILNLLLRGIGDGRRRASNVPSVEALTLKEFVCWPELPGNSVNSLKMSVKTAMTCRIKIIGPVCCYRYITPSRLSY